MFLTVIVKAGTYLSNAELDSQRIQARRSRRVALISFPVENPSAFLRIHPECIIAGQNKLLYLITASRNGSDLKTDLDFLVYRAKVFDPCYHPHIATLRITHIYWCRAK